MYSIARRTLITLVALTILFALTSCASDDVSVNDDKKVLCDEYFIYVGENMPLGMLPADSELGIEDDSIITIERGTVIAKKSGDTAITLRHGSTQESARVHVYDRIVSRDYAIIGDRNADRQCSDLLEAVSLCRDGDRLLIREGSYSDIPTIGCDISIEGEKGTYLAGLVVDRGARLQLSNLTIYAREYPPVGMGSVVLKEGGSLVARDTTFFLDKKEDLPSDRKGGSAIYVQPNSPLIDIYRCTFSRYLRAVDIASTGGSIHVIGNRFAYLDEAVRIDVRSEIMAENKPASGKVGDNSFYDVTKEVTLLYNGASYEGGLKVEKHDKMTTEE